jgi:cyanuric acid amidohydrolase
MECLVHRVPMRDPSDASAVLQLIEDGLIAPHEIVAIFGKTEGNGCVNDFTRGYATMALSVALAKPLGIAAEEVPSRVAIVMSGGTEGGCRRIFLCLPFASEERRPVAANPLQSARHRHRCCCPSRSAACRKWSRRRPRCVRL